MLASGRTARDEKRERNATTPDDEAREREERGPPRVTQAHSRSSGRKLTLTRLRVGFYARVLASGSTGLVRPFPTLCSLGAPGSSLHSARQLASPGACRHLDANPTISSPLHVASYIHVVHPYHIGLGNRGLGSRGRGHISDPLGYPPPSSSDPAFLSLERHHLHPAVAPHYASSAPPL